MASISTAANGTRRIEFTDPDRKVRTIYLGKLPKRLADEVKGKIERLNDANIAGHAPDAETARWAAALDDGMHAKLARYGLIAPREAAALGAFLDSYLDSRRNDGATKPATIDLLTRSAAEVEAYFGKDRRLRDVTAGHADDYRRHLTGRGLAKGTVDRRVGRAKQFFAAALRKELIDRNPFAGVKCQVRGNPDRSYFLSVEDAARVLDACPDVQWRLIFALARWGGLRCPSELLPLTWTDVDWERDRLTVTSPKTAHHEGGGHRVIPIFPELRPHLEAAFDAAAEGAVHVVTRCRDSRVNLRTQFQRIVRKAGLTPWPKLFHNLRATRQTELAGTFPMHVVCGWIGNTAVVAAEHYLTTTDADFDRAVAGGGLCAPTVAADPGGTGQSTGNAPGNATGHPSAFGGTGRPGATGTPDSVGRTPDGAGGGRTLPADRTPREGLEPST